VGEIEIGGEVGSLEEFDGDLRCLCGYVGK
jgi:hypothetical protein